MTEHLTHIAVQVSILAGLLIGLLALLVYLDKRRLKTHSGRPNLSRSVSPRKKHISNKNVVHKKRRKK